MYNTTRTQLTLLFIYFFCVHAENSSWAINIWSYRIKIIPRKKNTQKMTKNSVQFLLKTPTLIFFLLLPIHAWPRMQCIGFTSHNWKKKFGRFITYLNQISKESILFEWKFRTKMYTRVVACTHTQGMEFVGKDVKDSFRLDSKKCQSSMDWDVVQLLVGNVFNSKNLRCSLEIQIKCIQLNMFICLTPLSETNNKKK